MAEILLSLTIIGVVAAITLPSLTGNINERTWNTQRKALYARFSQAISLMPSLNGYGTLSPEQTDSAGSVTQSAIDTAAESFLTEGLAKVMKINNICDSEHLEDCGIPDKIIPIGDGSIVERDSIVTLQAYNNQFNSSLGFSQDIKAAAFETQNGESIIVYYNPYCKPEPGLNLSTYVQPRMCANFIYDLNGAKGPNTVGKDIGFISALYPTDPVVVAPLPAMIDISSNQKDGGAKCLAKDSESRLPNSEELASLFYNKRLLNLMTGGGNGYWSSTLVTSTTAIHMGMANGNRIPYGRTNTDGRVFCIKR